MFPVVSHLHRILGKTYSPTFCMRKVESGAVPDLPKAAQPGAEAELESRSADNRTFISFRQWKNNCGPWQRGALWNEDSASDNCKVISGRNEDKLELSSFNYTFTSDLSLRKN